MCTASPGARSPRLTNLKEDMENSKFRKFGSGGRESVSKAPEIVKLSLGYEEGDKGIEFFGKKRESGFSRLSSYVAGRTLEKGEKDGNGVGGSFRTGGGKETPRSGFAKGPQQGMTFEEPGWDGLMDDLPDRNKIPRLKLRPKP